MKLRDRLLGLLVLITIVFESICCFCLAFFLTEFIIKNNGWQLPNLLVQLINLVTSTIIFLVMSRIIFIRFNLATFARQKKLGIFGIMAMMVKAMDQISRGDYNIRLECISIKHNTVNELVEGMNQMAQQLSKMERMRQEFVANVSHEINSPLTSIRGFARTLQNDDLSRAEKLHYLSIIESESIRLSQLSEKLLKIASLDAETFEFASKPYFLNQQLRGIILASEPQWLEKQIEMEAWLDEVMITADENLLSEVWVNLIHNAIKYTPKGGVIRVDLHQQGDLIIVTIQDNGIGIAEADRFQIFERFYKADQSRDHSNQGSGLGLAIVKKIVDLHHGNISVQSKLSEGSTFTVNLPVKWILDPDRDRTEQKSLRDAP